MAKKKKNFILPVAALIGVGIVASQNVKVDKFVGAELPSDIASMSQDEALAEMQRLDALSSPTAADKKRLIAVELRLEQFAAWGTLQRAAELEKDPSKIKEAGDVEITHTVDASIADRGSRYLFPLLMAGVALTVFQKKWGQR